MTPQIRIRARRLDSPYTDASSSQLKVERRRLQFALLEIQQQVIRNKQRVAIIFEGRDAAGKTGTIKHFTDHLIPSGFDVVQLSVPTKKESKYWFRRYEKHLPKPGCITFFDRSWYNRALIEPTMGFCSENQYRYFMKKVNNWEEKLIDGGLILSKIYLSVSADIQLKRFKERITDPLTYWKFSEVDLKARERWAIFDNYKRQMFASTSSENAPWVIVTSTNKEKASLTAMLNVVNSLRVKRIEPLQEESVSNQDFRASIKRFESLISDEDETERQLTKRQLPNLNCEASLNLPKLVSAGGIVRRGDDILLIRKRGKWDLPKGKIEAGESLSAAARREICEETGIANSSLNTVSNLLSTWHSTVKQGKDHIKKSYWFLCHYEGSKETVPQKEEGITECVWVPLDSLSNYWDEMLPHIRYVVNFWLKNEPHFHIQSID